MGPDRRLTLLRHGHAHSAVDGEDRMRTLTPRGVREVEEMAQRLRTRDWIPELIVASPAARTWASAEIVARACGMGPRALRRAEALYGADAAAIWSIVAGCEPRIRHLLICGHNPGLSELASRFGPRPRLRRLPTAGLASAAWNDADWQALEAGDAAHCESDEPAREPPGARARNHD
ncbi:MAG TPA: histidine phosphatase family protein [Steroidobacteraceae bacterium]|nr:histidine phosphatase family protein [Steroidobacteraceae bacterium]